MLLGSCVWLVCSEDEDGDGERIERSTVFWPESVCCSSVIVVAMMMVEGLK